MCFKNMHNYVYKQTQIIIMVKIQRPIKQYKSTIVLCLNFRLWAVEVIKLKKYFVVFLV